MPRLTTAARPPGFNRPEQITLGDRIVDYQLIRSKVAKKLRVRVGPRGMEVVQPDRRTGAPVEQFLQSHAAWILRQLDRMEGLKAIRRRNRLAPGTILFRGEPKPLRFKVVPGRSGGNRVIHDAGGLLVIVGAQSKTLAAKSLEYWFRAQARATISEEIEVLAAKLKKRPGRLYLMSQRTRWGNCSAKGNLSFNWRLMMAPDFVLQYLVTHEVVHLAIPNHAKRYWLAVQSHCPDMEKAKRWLKDNYHLLQIDLTEFFESNRKN